MAKGNESLILKWGTIKGYGNLSPKSIAIAKRYVKLGVSMSAMAQDITDEHRKVLCELIDSIDGTISNDWSGQIYTKEEAKNYVMSYAKKDPK
jgi:hypothetical protein